MVWRDLTRPTGKRRPALTDAVRATDGEGRSANVRAGASVLPDGAVAGTDRGRRVVGVYSLVILPFLLAPEPAPCAAALASSPGSQAEAESNRET